MADSNLFSNYYAYVIATLLVLAAVSAEGSACAVVRAASSVLPKSVLGMGLATILCLAVVGMLLTMAFFWIIDSHKYTNDNEANMSSDEKLLRNITDLFLFIIAIMASVSAAIKVAGAGRIMKRLVGNGKKMM